MRGGRCWRLSVTSTAAAAAVMVGGIFVCSGTAPPYSLLAERQPALHSRPWSSRNGLADSRAPNRNQLARSMCANCGAFTCALVIKMLWRSHPAHTQDLMKKHWTANSTVFVIFDALSSSLMIFAFYLLHFA